MHPENPNPVSYDLYPVIVFSRLCHRFCLRKLTCSAHARICDDRCQQLMSVWEDVLAESSNHNRNGIDYMIFPRDLRFTVRS